jgi:MFS superfamily sulfate permease-like transporter
MIQENEMVMLVLGLGVLILIQRTRRQLKRVPSSNIVISGFYVLLAAWVLTVLEGFYCRELFNFLEHTCYAVSSLLVATWCWKALGRGRELR